MTGSNGETSETRIEITVIGTNDAPIAEAEVARNISQDAAVISGQLGSSDLDDGATATFEISEGDQSPAGFELNANGSYRFDPGVDTYLHLKAGASQLLKVPVTVTDEHGVTDTTEIQITVTGTNDAPVAEAEVVREVDEGGAVISGRLSASDSDDGDSMVFSSVRRVNYRRDLP